MAVKIRLKRMGKIRAPYYRVVVVDSRKKRDGRVIEEIGKYHPKEEPSLIDLTSDRAQYWLGVGAQPSEAVEALLKITGDWQKFKGLPGTEGSLRVADSKRDKADIFNEALKDAGSEPKSEAVTKKAVTKKAAAKKPAAKAPAEEATQAPADEATQAPAEEAPAAAGAGVDGTPVEAPAGLSPEAAAASADAEGEAQPTEADATEAEANKPADADADADADKPADADADADADKPADADADKPAGA
ncbi:MAG: 30S ribosomal protein S16 [Nocardioides sp.]